MFLCQTVQIEHGHAELAGSHTIMAYDPIIYTWTVWVKESPTILFKHTYKTPPIVTKSSKTYWRIKMNYNWTKKAKSTLRNKELTDLQQTHGVEDMAAVRRGELITGVEQLETRWAVHIHVWVLFVSLLPLEYVEVFPPGHLLPLLYAQLVGDVVQALHLGQQGRQGQVAQLWEWRDGCLWVVCI